ncbi:cadherin domain-containing protein [Chlorobaculum sp. 24CR]|uniref:cadherin domain-containing protein n=1 Tax=Chlorobaculum sp. 24CR TaxID=2508878 RepID=UPI001430A3BB|nr:cadherin domain-containing protein [Chlorobaculum sp. 24CR]
MVDERAFSVAFESRNQKRRELVIADPDIADSGMLLDDLRSGVEVWTADSAKNVIAVLAEAVSEGFDAIHLLAHGAPGSICFGSRNLRIEDFRTLAIITGAGGNAMPSLHFWSCKTAQGEAGRQFVQEVSELFGVQVTAFSGLVGARKLGGNWVPDVCSHEMLTVPVPFTEALAYAHTLVAEITDPVLELHPEIVAGKLNVEVWIKGGTTVNVLNTSFLYDTADATISKIVLAPIAWSASVAGIVSGTTNNLYFLATAPQNVFSGESEPVYFESDGLLVTLQFTIAAGASGVLVLFDTETSVTETYTAIWSSDDTSDEAALDLGHLTGIYYGLNDPNLTINLDGTPVEESNDRQTVLDLYDDGALHDEATYAGSVTVDDGEGGQFQVNLYDDDGGGMPNRYEFSNGSQWGIIVYNDDNTFTRYQLSDSGDVTDEQEGRLALDGDDRVVGLIMTENYAPSGDVTITGDAEQYETLTAHNTLDDPDGNGEVTYQWQADGENIPDATGDTLELADEALVGKTITVVASYQDGEGLDESVSSDPTDPVENTNDAPTITSDLTAAVDENADPSTLIYTAIATDPDAGDHVSYSLQGTDAASFTIDPDSGDVTLNQSPDFEVKNEYAIEVVATDDGSLTDTKEVTVSVNDVAEAPTGIGLSSNTIAENTVVGGGVLIGTLTVTDPDATGNNNVLSLEGDDAGDFEIRNGGELYFVGASPDFETKDHYDVTVKSIDGDLEYSEAFTVNVTDVNETPTGIGLSSNTIAENTEVGTGVLIGTLAVTDPDATGNDNVLSLEGDDAGDFEIRNGDELYFVGASPDYETKDHYDVTVKSTDGDLEYSEAFTVNVTDVAEAPTDIALSSNTIAENIEVGTGVLIGTLAVTDPDASDNNNVLSLEGTDSGDFEIRNGNELYYVGASPDYETKDHYDVTVKSTDGDLEYSEDFTVNVTNVNEAPTGIELSSNTIAENTEVGTGVLIGTLAVTDSDASDNDNELSLEGTDSGDFEIRNDNELFFIGDSPDYETKDHYDVSVKSTDGDLTYCEDFTVNVTDVNEAPSASNSTVNVTVGREKTLSVADFNFNDPDVGDSLLSVKIAILPDRGELMLNGVDVNADEEIDKARIDAGDLKYTPAAGQNADDNAELTFSVFDQAGLESGTATLTLDLVDNNPPTLTGFDGVVAETQEDTQQEITFADLAAKGDEADEDEGGSVTAFVVKAVTSGTLLIGANAGTATAFVAGMNDTVDAAHNAYWTPAANDNGEREAFTVTALDNYGDQSTDPVAVTVDVVAVNDAPTGIELSSNTIAENTEIGDGVLIGTLTVTDPDATGNNNALSLEGTDSGDFEIRNGDELYYIGASPDYETKDHYDVTVKSTDGDLEYSEEFTVNVTNVNEAPTGIGLSSNTIDENTVVGTGVLIGTLTVTDPDASGNDNVLSLDGTDAGNFEIRGNDLYYIGASPNYEAKDHYDVTVKSTDGSLTYSEAFTVNVTNVNEAPTGIELSSNTIDENTEVGAGVLIGTLTVTDSDATGNDNELSLEGDDAASFEIRNSNELYYVGASQDFETKDHYDVTVKSTDGDLEYSEDFTVNVTDVNEAPTDLTLSLNTIAENTVVSDGVLIGTLTVTDTDATGNNNVLSLEGTDAASFEIRGSDLYFIGASPDFETKDHYDVSVKSTDGVLEYSEAFTVNVTDVAEAPTDIDLSHSTITEGTVFGGGVKIGTLTVTDPDATSNNNVLSLEGTDVLSFEIRNGNELYFIGATPDYENKDHYDVTVKSTDGDLIYSESFTVNVNQVFTGGDYDDSFVGGGGDDTLSGGAGNDTLYGGDGDDSVDGGDGDDEIIGGSGNGNDHYIGGTDSDTIVYGSAKAGIYVNLDAGEAGSLEWFDTVTDSLVPDYSDDPAEIGYDTLTGIENVEAGDYADRIIGSSDDNWLQGGDGNDTIEGLGGNDKIIGGGGDGDTVVFSGSLSDYDVSYNSTTQTFTIQDMKAGRDGTDTVSEVEHFLFGTDEYDAYHLMNLDAAVAATGGSSGGISAGEMLAGVAGLGLLAFIIF